MFIQYTDGHNMLHFELNYDNLVTHVFSILYINTDRGTHTHTHSDVTIYIRWYYYVLLLLSNVISSSTKLTLRYKFKSYIKRIIIEKPPPP